MPFAYIELKKITNAQLERLRDEVVTKCFNRASLDQFLSEDIGGLTLELISSESTFEEQCRQVLGWFSDNNRAGEFCNLVQLKFPQQKGLLEQILADTSTGLRRSPLRDYLHLFDRADQEQLFTDAFVDFPQNAPVPPVVVVISGLPDDEAHLMLERIMRSAIPAVFDGKYQKTVPHALNWVTTVSAVKLVRELANKILGVSTLRDDADSLVSRMKDRIAEQTVCMTLQTNLCNPQNVQILGEFLGHWSRLGEYPKPPIFFLLVLDREPQDAAAEGSITPAEAYAAVKNALPSGATVTVVNHLALNPCDPNHIQTWRYDLEGSEEIDRDAVKSACDLLDSKLGGLPTFRLRRVKSELGGYL